MHDCKCGFVCMWCYVHVVHIVLCLGGVVYTLFMWCRAYVVLCIHHACGVVYMLCFVHVVKLVLCSCGILIHVVLCPCRTCCVVYM